MFNIVKIKDKQYCDKGLIDGGIYIIKKNIFAEEKNSQFCFNDFLSDYQKSHLVGACVFDKSFIDIGTPEHFKQAQSFFLGAI